MSSVNVKYKNREIVIDNKKLSEVKDGECIDLSFQGHYLIQFQRDDNTFFTTGKGIDGWGNPTEVENTTFLADLD